MALSTLSLYTSILNLLFKRSLRKTRIACFYSHFELFLSCGMYLVLCSTTRYIVSPLKRHYTTSRELLGIEERIIANLCKALLQFPRK